MSILKGIIIAVGVFLGIVLLLLLEVGVAAGIAALLLWVINLIGHLFTGDTLIPHDVFLKLWAISTFIVFVGNRLMRG